MGQALTIGDMQALTVVSRTFFMSSLFKKFEMTLAGGRFSPVTDLLKDY